MSVLKEEAQDNLPVIDLDLGAKILGSSKETAKEMIAQLVSMLPQDLKKIQTAYADHNYETLKDLAHYVKGGASFCGTPRLTLFAGKLEQIIHHQQTHSIEFKKAYDQLCSEMLAVITEYSKI